MVSDCREWLQTRIPSGRPIESVGVDNFFEDQRLDVLFRVHLRKIGEVDDQRCGVGKSAHSIPVVEVVLSLLSQSEMEKDATG